MTTGAGLGPAAAQLLSIIDDALARLTEGTGRQAVLSVRERLTAPLRVTIGGAVSSGKSTLVNALLGQQVAAVDAGECTRVVTEFRYGSHERAEVVTTAGARRVLALERGRLPAALGVPLELVDHVVVHLSNATLASYSIVDTPGLNTVTRENEEATASFLGLGHADRREAARADALIFLLPHLRGADAAFLEGFRDLYAGSGLSAINAVGVLSKADKLSRLGAPMEIAAPIASRMAHELGGLVTGIFPIVGLLAETASAALLTEADARALEQLARLDELDREDLLLTPEDFLAGEVDVSVDTRRRLLARLDLYGLELTIGTIAAGGRGAGPLLRALDAASGLGPLRRVLAQQFAGPADLLKTHAAMCDLARLAWQPPAVADAAVLRSLRDPLEQLELDPSMHRLALFDLVQSVARGELGLTVEQRGEIERLAVSDDPCVRTGTTRKGQAGEVAAARAGAWATWGGDAFRAPAEMRAARVVRTAYELIWVETREVHGG